MQHSTTNAKQNGKAPKHLGKLKLYLAVIAALMLTYIHGANAQGSWYHSVMSSANGAQGAVSSGSKVYFAGGTRSSTGYTPSSLIDIYDVKTGVWTYKNLSAARELPAAVKNGNKLFFAGGMIFDPPQFFSVVDIYDTQTGYWDTAHLSQARWLIAAVSYGDEILFAGGAFSGAIDESVVATVDIYNTVTGVWDTAALSEPRSLMGYAVAGTKAIFAGGWNGTSMTNRVDIYDFITHTWSTDTLSLARGFLAATTVGNKVIIGGGMINLNTPSNRVDIYDVVEDTWETSSLSRSRAFLKHAASACGEAFFAGGGTFKWGTLPPWISATDVVDIYDPINKTWRIAHLTHNVVEHSVVANVEADPDHNYLLVAGGTDAVAYSFAWADIYSCLLVGTNDLQSNTSLHKVYPNPASNNLTIAFANSNKKVEITITDITGKIVYDKTITDAENVYINTSIFPEGVYVVRVQTRDFIETKKVIVAK